jgi:dephospho-CoA kinase
MQIIGLTGSIGMGKSTVARALRRLGIPVHDADAEVHCLLRQDSALIQAVETSFPGVSGADGINRQKLAERVLGDPVALQRLEALVHPCVRRSQAFFIKSMRGRRCPLVVLDIPLLFETEGDAYCDRTIVVAAPSFLQRQRVLARPGMSVARFIAIRARQMPDEQKLRRADVVIPTGLDRRFALRILTQAIAVLRTSMPQRRAPRRSRR